MTLPSTCRGFGRTFHSTVPNLDMKDSRFRAALADIPAATPAQMAAFERQAAIRRHYDRRSQQAGKIYNRLSRQLDIKRARSAGKITDQAYWAMDDALWAKLERIKARCNIMRDVRIAAVTAETAP